jgi:hypothetical protein
MKTKNIIVFVAFAASLIFVGCGGNDSEDMPLPGAVTLVSPSGNSACIQGTTESDASEVAFSWNAATNAENYRIDITNLNSQVKKSYTVSKLSYSTSLNNNAFYSWCVTAINGGGSTGSDTLKFYLSGTPASNYAPFPTKLLTPEQGAVINANGAAAVQVAFRWVGSDIDNDIARYALYLDNVDASTPVGSSLTTATTTQTLERGKTYYWKVVTTDKAGNSSCSTVRNFIIQ